MLLILLPMSPVQTVAAETLQDLSIQSAVQPRIDGHYDRWDSIDPLAMIRSEALVQISTRDIEVELCPGNHTLSAECPNDSNLWSRTLILASIMPGSTIEANFGGTQFLAHQSGVHTAVFKFSDQDLDPSDDVLTYLFYIDDPLRDVELSNIDWNETLVRNSGVEYPVPITIDSRNWLTDEPIEVGWSLFKLDAEVGRAGACFYIGLGTANQSDVPVDTVPPRLATIITPGEADNRTIEFSSPDLTSGSSYNLS